MCMRGKYSSSLADEVREVQNNVSHVISIDIHVGQSYKSYLNRQ